MPNLRFIKEHGIKQFMEQQKRRIRLLKRMIDGFDDGRSKSYYCRSAAVLDPVDVERSLTAAAGRIEAEHVKPDDAKTKAKILRGILDGLTSKY